MAKVSTNAAKPAPDADAYTKDVCLPMTTRALRLVQRSRDGIAHVTLFEQHGIPRGIIWHLCKAQRLISPARGLFVLPSASLDAIEARLSVRDELAAAAAIRAIFGENVPMSMPEIRALGIGCSLARTMLRSGLLVPVPRADGRYVMPVAVKQAA